MKELEIIELDSKNIKHFAQQMPKMKLNLIAFLATWCGHCNDFKPEWHKIKQHFKDKKSVNGHIVTIDEKLINELPSDVKKPRGFPTMSLYKGTKHIEDYNGGRNFPEMVKFIEKQMGRGQSGGSPKTISKTIKKRKRLRGRSRFRGRSKNTIKRKSHSKKMKNKILGNCHGAPAPRHAGKAKQGKQKRNYTSKKQICR